MKCCRNLSLTSLLITFVAVEFKEKSNEVCSEEDIFVIRFFRDRMGQQCQKMSTKIQMVVKIPKTHVKCRSSAYPKTEGKVVRPEVSDSKVCWSVPFPDYAPLEYNAPVILLSRSVVAWADPDLNDPNFKPKFNESDGQINRQSFLGEYKIDPQGRPLNPMGRTGLTGRGVLGKWGPNHAADPIVTRWKRNSHDDSVAKSSTNGRPILQCVLILRGDCGEWAIPGGMVDAGEEISATLRREFSEETLNCLAATADEKKKIETAVNGLFKHGVEVYKGYVDDPRNTDNAWMETVAMNFHDETGKSVGKIELKAGDDAVGVQWKDVESGMKLYASHLDFVEAVAKFHNAHW